MDNYFFSNLAIMVILLSSLFPLSFFYFLTVKIGPDKNKRKQRPTVDLKSLDDLKP
jgi:hypothetical protein